MGTVAVCKYKRTKTPWFLEQAGVNLYSAEELAWFLYHNIWLADRRMFDEGLCRWLEEEAGCEELAKRIRSGIASGSSFQNLAISVAGAAGIFDGHDLAELAESMKGLTRLQEQERLKLRADGFLDNENEWAAIEEYRHILDMHQNSSLGMAFYGAVWNNLGVCYARQFLFQEAAKCFEISCEYQPDEEAERQAKLAEELSRRQPGREKKGFDFSDPQKKLLRWEREYRVRRKR